MGWKDIGRAIKKGVTDVGHGIGSALNNPVVKGIGTAALAASGVGLPAAIALGAGTGALGGALRPGGGLKGAITQGGQGALLGATGSIGGTVGRAALGAAAGGGTPGGPLGGGSAMGAIKGIAGNALGGLGSQALGAITGNGGLNALGLAQGVNAAMLSKQSTDFANRAMGDVQHSYDERAPLRALGLQGLTNPTAPNVGGIRKVAGTGNPFAPTPLGVR